MQKSGFFNANLVDEEYDREYLAQDFADYFASFIGNGVFPQPSTNLQVLVSSGMTASLGSGQAWINGYWYGNTTPLPLTLEPAHGTLDRIDSVGVRYSSSGRIIEAFVNTGTPNVSPIAPAPQRDADAYELVVAHVRVGKGTIAIQQSAITDKRIDKAVCGWVVGLVDQIDTETLGNQLQGFIDEFIKRMNDDYDNFKLFDALMRSKVEEDYKNFQIFDEATRNQVQEDYEAYVQFTTNHKTQMNTDYENFLLYEDNKRKQILSVYNTFVEYVNQYKEVVKNSTLEYQLDLETLKTNATELYDSLVDYISNPATGLKKKAEDEYFLLMEWFESFKVKSSEEFADWFESIKGILNDDVATELLGMVGALQDKSPNNLITKISVDEMDNYLKCRMLEIINGAAMQAYGAGGFGSSQVKTCEQEFEYFLGDGVAIYSGKRFVGEYEVTKAENDVWLIIVKGTKYSIIFEVERV